LRTEPDLFAEVWTVPVVRATGGLDDTIEEWDAEKGTGTGFKFHGYEARDLLAAVDPRVGGLPQQEGVDAADAEWNEAEL